MKNIVLLYIVPIFRSDKELWFTNTFPSEKRENTRGRGGLKGWSDRAGWGREGGSRDGGGDLILKRNREGT